MIERAIQLEIASRGGIPRGWIVLALVAVSWGAVWGLWVLAQLLYGVFAAHYGWTP